MTLEEIKEAVEVIKAYRQMLTDSVSNQIDEDIKAFDVAVEAMEREACGDAISRQAVLDAFGLSEKTRKYGGDHSGYDTMMKYEIQDVIEDLPSVNPQEPKTGHWIMPQQDDGMSDPIYYQVRCSACGFDLDPQTWHQELNQYGADKYCPMCGAKMVEPQERSGDV